MNRTLETTKQVVVFVAGIGIATVVKSVIKNNAPEPSGKISKAIVLIGTAALSATLVHMVNKRATEMIDDAIDTVKSIRTEIKEAKA